MLELMQLSKTFKGPDGPVKAVAEFSLHLSAGELAAVRGPSGAGKTTLLLMAGGLLHPDSGHVILNGTDLYRLSPESRARFRAENIGFVFQQFHLLPYLTVRDNVLASQLVLPRAPPRQQDMQSPTRQRGTAEPACQGQRHVEERADELLAQFGLARRARHVPAQLSTGERQRTALARALLPRPRLLLADEPTGNLDDDNGGIVLAALAEYARQAGAVLLVTHDARVAGLAQRTVVLQPQPSCAHQRCGP